MSDDVTILDIYKASAKAFILGYTGLTTDEINICFKDSAIQQIVRDLPPTFD